jgi:centromere protein C
MVDLPAGAVKKPKNSRKMQMVFFVFSGRVQVNVNDNEFRIGKGGMWQVPRGMFVCSQTAGRVLTFAGNFYSIVNDYDKPARIFFAQGCEVQEEVPEGQ